MAAPRDTRADAWARQLAAFRAMPPSDRVRLALAMTDEVNELARAGIRARHPDWSPAQVQEGLQGLVLGVEVAGRARRGHTAAKR